MRIQGTSSQITTYLLVLREYILPSTKTSWGLQRPKSVLVVYKTTTVKLHIKETHLVMLF